MTRDRTADLWLAGIEYPPLADLLAGVIARSPLARGKISKWTRSRKEFTRQAGYAVLCRLLSDEPDGLDEQTCRSNLETIERRIHDSPKQARNAMNMAVIAIGIYKPTLRKNAVAAAKRIGKVDVDHGQRSCKTPDAVAYIQKAAARQASTRKRPTRRARR